jgi:hypothetical protein
LWREWPGFCEPTTLLLIKESIWVIFFIQIMFNKY